MFGYQIGLVGDSVNPIQKSIQEEEEKQEDVHATPTPTPTPTLAPASPWMTTATTRAATPLSQPISLTHANQFGGYSDFQQPQHTAPSRWLPTTLPPHPSHQPEMVHQGQLGHTLNTHAGLIFMDPGMSGGIPTAQGTGTEQVLPHIDWDAYQQMMQFDPNFELYMNGPNDRYLH